MKIGLIDVDGRHGKKKWGATIYPNVALGKIARWHTIRGDEVEWAQPTDLFDRHHYDILYASKVFNFSTDIDFRQFSYDRLEKGGTGYDIYKRLPDEIDRLQPLYELFPWVPKNHEGRAVYAYAQPYRNPTNPNHVIPEWQKDMARWCNKRMIFCTTDFKDFMPRKGFKCEGYLKKYGI